MGMYIERMTKEYKLILKDFDKLNIPYVVEFGIVRYTS